MLVGATGRSAGMHSTKPLVVRGGLARTFGSLAGFLALICLSAGLYLLDHATANPLTAQPGDVISAAVLVALATILFFYLFKPRNRRKLH
jgi:hypothetical protein